MMNFKRIISLVFLFTMVLMISVLGSGTVAQATSQLLNLDPTTTSRVVTSEYDAWPANPGEAHVALWDDNKTGALSVTIDDNYDTEHNTWLNFSTQYGFKFTWFVITRNTGSPSFNPTEWTRMIAEGQDVQSHSKSHYSTAVQSTLTTDQWIEEYSQPITAINALSGGNCKTIGLPYGTGNTEIERQYYIAGRGTTGRPNEVGKVDYNKTNSYSISYNTKISYTSGSDISIESAIRTLIDPNYLVWNKSYYKGWTNMHYHSLLTSGTNPSTGTTLQVSDVAAYMLNYLDTYKSQVWVAPFTEIAMYGQERDTHTLTVTQNSANLIKFTLSDQMNDEKFTCPLTVKVRVHNDWNNVAATQDGVSIPASIVTYNSNQYVLVKAVPDKGEVSLAYN